MKKIMTIFILSLMILSIIAIGVNAQDTEDLGLRAYAQEKTLYSTFIKALFGSSFAVITEPGGTQAIGALKPNQDVRVDFVSDPAPRNKVNGFELKILKTSGSGQGLVAGRSYSCSGLGIDCNQWTQATAIQTYFFNIAYKAPSTPGDYKLELVGKSSVNTREWVDSVNFRVESTQIPKDYCTQSKTNVANGERIIITCFTYNKNTGELLDRDVEVKIRCDDDYQKSGTLCIKIPVEDPVEEDPVEEDPVEEDPVEEDPVEITCNIGTCDIQIDTDICVDDKWTTCIDGCWEEVTGDCSIAGIPDGTIPEDIIDDTTDINDTTIQQTYEECRVNDNVVKCTWKSISNWFTNLISRFSI